MCDVLNIPHSTFYQSLQYNESKRDQKNRKITDRILQIHKESKHRYGAPKTNNDTTVKSLPFSKSSVDIILLIKYIIPFLILNLTSFVFFK